MATKPSRRLKWKDFPECCKSCEHQRPKKVSRDGSWGKYRNSCAPDLFMIAVMICQCPEYRTSHRVERLVEKYTKLYLLE